MLFIAEEEKPWWLSREVFTTAGCHRFDMSSCRAQRICKAKEARHCLIFGIWHPEIFYVVSMKVWHCSRGRVMLYFGRVLFVFMYLRICVFVYLCGTAAVVGQYYISAASSFLPFLTNNWVSPKYCPLIVFLIILFTTCFFTKVFPLRARLNYLQCRVWCMFVAVTFVFPFYHRYCRWSI